VLRRLLGRPCRKRRSRFPADRQGGRKCRKRRSRFPADRLDLPDGVLDYDIRASDCRRLSLRLDAEGQLTVSAPHALSLAAIREFVVSRRGWIKAKRALLAEAPPPLRLENGAALPFLGGFLELNVVPRTPARCRREADRLVVHALDPYAAHRTLEGWYRKTAAQYFAERIAHFAPRVGKAPRRITVRAQRSRWGSCTSQGTVSLNWRLLQMPAAIVDYVIVHELCHLLVPNHSPRFWAEVARLLPDWRERRRALRAAGRALRF